MFENARNNVVNFARSLRKSGPALAVAATAGALTLPGPAAAALSLDSSEILGDIATVVGFITVVGLAVLGMVFVAKAIKWARRAG